MDFRSRRRCGNVRKLPVPAALWETCLQDVGKACPFPCAVNGFSIGASGSFPHFHDAYFYPEISRYMVNGTYRTATISRQTRMKPPITPPMIKFSANSAIPPPKEPPPGTIQRHIRWRPKGSTLFRKNVLIVSLLVIRQTSFHDSIIQGSVTTNG